MILTSIQCYDCCISHTEATKGVCLFLGVFLRQIMFVWLTRMGSINIMKHREHPQMGRRYWIKNKAAIALQCILISNLIAALFLFLFRIAVLFEEITKAPSSSSLSHFVSSRERPWRQLSGVGCLACNAIPYAVKNVKMFDAWLKDVHFATFIHGCVYRRHARSTGETVCRSVLQVSIS